MYRAIEPPHIYIWVYMCVDIYMHTVPEMVGVCKSHLAPHKTPHLTVFPGREGVSY